MSTPTPPSPSPTATPAEVRAYFSTLLTTLHSVPNSEAEKIAAGWQFGRGSELKYYDLSTFREIFGVEAGTVLFGHARGELSGDGAKAVVNGSNISNGLVLKKGKIEKDIFGVTPGLSLVYLLFAMSLLFGFSAWFAESDERAAGMMMLAVFSTAGFIMAYFAFYFL